jgi:proprotein convertase subtilisin/kexin type 5
LNSTTHECIRNCPDYYFENTANQCESCAFGCLTCTSASNCISCNSDSDHRELRTVSGVKTCVCKERYFQPAAGTICFACIRDCLTCSDETTCDVCDTDNNYVLIPNNTCQNCGYGCSTCTNALVCTACSIGYYNPSTKTCLSSCPDYTFENNANKQCDACAFGCHTCSSSTNCISCDSSTDRR